MIRCLSYLNSMSDITNKKYQILVLTITFNIIVFNEQELKKAGAALVTTITGLKYCGKSFINKENKTGLKPSPCLIPLLQENRSVSVLRSILTQLLIEEYMDFMIFRNFP